MSTMKRLFTCLLAMTMLVSAAFCWSGSALATDIQPVTMELTNEDQQLSFIYSQLASLKQTEGENPWYYAVTDLDHDGLLEFVAASQHPQDRSTNLKVWEVGSDKNSLTECTLAKDPDESFPDILTDAADTFHDTATDTWNYLFYDNVIISPTNVYTSKSAYHLKDGVISYEAYAVEHISIENGVRTVSHTDMEGTSISPEQYNAAGLNAFAGAERSSTSFEWLTAAEVDSLSRVIDSFSVFMGRKAPTEVFPVPKPEVLQAPAVTAAPAETAAPAPAPTPAPAQPVYLSITKNPTNENRTEGGTALFVSCANVYESLNWTIVSPDGTEYTIPGFRSVFTSAAVSGEYSTTLSIANVNTSMNGWGAYCTFYYQGQFARTTTAYMYVSAKQNSSAPSGTYSGTVTDWNYGSVTVLVANTVSVTIPYGKCDIDGDLYIGAYASVNWNGSDVTYCYISGSRQQVGPIYGSMSGTAYEGGAGYAIYLSNGDQVFVDSWLCNVSDYFYDGASCVVYYQNYPSSANIYSVDIYGSSYYPGDSNDWNLPFVSVNELYDNIWDELYWDQNNFEGGWAGSNYYDNEYTFGDSYIYEIHDAFNDDGSTYNTVTCPNCYREVSMAYDTCPNCGFDLWD